MRAYICYGSEKSQEFNLSPPGRRHGQQGRKKRETVFGVPAAVPRNCPPPQPHQGGVATGCPDLRRRGPVTPGRRSHGGVPMGRCTCGSRRGRVRSRSRAEGEKKTAQQRRRDSSPALSLVPNTTVTARSSLPRLCLCGRSALRDSFFLSFLQNSLNHTTHSLTKFYFI